MFLRLLWRSFQRSWRRKFYAFAALAAISSIATILLSLPEWSSLALTTLQESSIGQIILVQSEILLILKKTLWVLLVALTPLALVCVGSTWHLLCLERTAELSLMKSLGASRTHLLTQLWCECSLVGVGGSLVGYLLCTFLTPFFLKSWGAPDISFQAQFLSLTLVILIGFLLTTLALLPTLSRVIKLPSFHGLREDV